MRFKMMALAAATIIAVPAIAQTADSTAPASNPKPKKEKKICRSLEPLSGSRMVRTICRTQDEWNRNGNTGNDGAASVRSVTSDDATG
jgi:predicted secreted protein